ncbi:MAG: hypothetical protein JXR84_01145 [Anaerolineae bacterium]|nr:hypothetical protein [Anaerolineae bacterium]
METAQQMIIEQLRAIAVEVQRIPQILARLDTIAAAQQRLEQHDEEQARAIADLKSRDNEFTASFTVLSSEIRQLTRDIDALKTETSPLNQYIQKINAVGVRVNQLETCTKDFSKWESWLRGWKWATILAGTIALTAVIVGVLWAVGQSGALIP